MYIFSIIRAIRKGFKFYGKENFFTRYADRIEALLISSIENSDVEKLKYNIRCMLFVYAWINLFVFSLLEKYLGSLIAFQGKILSYLYIFAILGLLSKSTYYRIKRDLLIGLKKYTSWFLKVEIFICLGYYIFCFWYLKEYSKSFDSKWIYFYYSVGFFFVIYCIYLLSCLVVQIASYANYTSGNLMAIGLKRFLAHCKKHQKEDPLQLMLFLTETSLAIISFLWLLI